LSFENMTVAQVIEYAFEVRAPQISGGPDWLREDRFDIDGILPSGATATPAIFRAMTRTLLEQRFALRAHRETRSSQVLALVIAAGDRALGPALKPSAIECTNGPDGPTCWKRSRAGEVQAAGYDWARINLPLDLMRYGVGQDLMIVDRTGLQGRFDLHLRWTPQMDSTVPDLGLPPASGGLDSAPAATALRDQLGLVLRREQAPIEYVVIDEVSRPAAN
jgi:uncharacterized protein (TIGR03435 family)